LARFFLHFAFSLLLAGEVEKWITPASWNCGVTRSACELANIQVCRGDTVKPRDAPPSPHWRSAGHLCHDTSQDGRVAGEGRQTADWATVTAATPITGGQKVRIEWHFTGGGDEFYLGAYIDEVVVSAP
jgi:hypothetical protein